MVLSSRVDARAPPRLLPLLMYIRVIQVSMVIHILWYMEKWMLHTPPGQEDPKVQNVSFGYICHIAYANEAIWMKIQLKMEGQH